MSFEEYLHEKAAESRHKESVGFSLIVLGITLLIGGLLITSSLLETPIGSYLFLGNKPLIPRV